MTDETPDFEDLRINLFTQPMHLFDGPDAETALCGIGIEAANNQDADLDEPFSAELFPATNNYDGASELFGHWVADSGATCHDCLAVFKGDDE